MESVDSSVTYSPWTQNIPIVNVGKNNSCSQVSHLSELSQEDGGLTSSSQADRRGATDAWDAALGPALGRQSSCARPTVLSQPRESPAPAAGRNQSPAMGRMPRPEQRVLSQREAAEVRELKAEVAALKEDIKKHYEEMATVQQLRTSAERRLRTASVRLRRTRRRKRRSRRT